MNDRQGTTDDHGKPGPGSAAARIADPKFFAAMARALGRFERSELGGGKGIEDFGTLLQAFPDIGLSTRTEPRAAFARLIAAAQQADETAVPAALARVLGNDDLTDDELCLCISVVADSGVALPQGIIFLALDLLSEIEPSFDQEEAVAALIFLAGTDAPVLVSLLERLSELDSPHISAFFAGLQSIASIAPTLLGAMFSLHAGRLEDDSVDLEALGYVLNEICRRAGPFTTLLALAEPDPFRCPKLLRAAFASPGAPFHFVRDFFDDEEEQKIQIADDERTYPLTNERLGKSVQKWIAHARSAIREASGADDDAAISSGNKIYFFQLKAESTESELGEMAQLFFQPPSSPVQH